MITALTPTRDLATHRYHGSYEAIEGGLVHLALVDMTGGSSEMITMSEVRPAIDDGSLFKKLKSYADMGYLLGAGSPSGSDTNTSAAGIVQGHAYSIFRVEQVGHVQLLQLRNPWGRKVWIHARGCVRSGSVPHGGLSQEWNGDWSDKDTKRWNRRMISKLNYDPAAADPDDGMFWMSFADFTRHYRRIYVCRLFEQVKSGPKWHK